MSGFTKIGGTNYEIKQGFTSIGGTQYEIKEGWTKVNDNLQKINMSQYSSFADASWEDVVSACQSNTVPEIWKVEDTKTIDDGNGGQYTVTIIGKGHDTDTDGNKCPLTLQVTAGPETDTNCSKVFTSSSFFNKLPEVVKNGLKKVNGKDWGATTTGLTGWYLSVTEVLGSDYTLNNLKYVNSGYLQVFSDVENSTTPTLVTIAGSQYEYYTNNKVSSSYGIWTRSTGRLSAPGGNANQKIYIKRNGETHNIYNYDTTGTIPNTADTTCLAAWAFCL